MEFIHSEIFIRAIGIIAFILGVAAFQSNKHKGIVVAKLGSEAAFTIQYYLLDAPTGAIMNLVGVVRNFIFYKLVEKEKSTKAAMWIFAGFILFLQSSHGRGLSHFFPLLVSFVQQLLTVLKIQEQ